MKNSKFDINKIGIICSITQVVISIICLIYNIVTNENYMIWIVMLCSGIVLLSSNIDSRKGKK